MLASLWHTDCLTSENFSVNNLEKKVVGRKVLRGCFPYLTLYYNFK